MLILTRRLQEKIIINGNIEVTLIEITGQQARIGVKAPASVTIDREEIYVRKQREKEARDA